MLLSHAGFYNTRAYISTSSLQYYDFKFHINYIILDAFPFPFNITFSEICSYLKCSPSPFLNFSIFMTISLSHLVMKAITTTNMPRLKSCNLSLCTPAFTQENKTLLGACQQCFLVCFVLLGHTGRLFHWYRWTEAI